MFNFFRRQPQKTYVVVARYYRGHWFRQFEVQAASRYEAARKFDQSEEDSGVNRIQSQIKHFSHFAKGNALK